jgi:putative ABC transport system permease protein
MTRWLVRLLLACAPRSFREGTGAECLAVFDERACEPRTMAARAAFSVREVWGGAYLVTGLWVAEVFVKHGKGGGATMFETTTQDTRFAVRTLRRNPGFAFAAISVLALGIGANTAIFSAVNAFFFRPLPFAQAEELVTIFETNPEFGWVDVTAAPANLLDWRDEVEAFSDVSGYSEFTSQITTFRDGEPVLVGGTAVLGNFFETLGVPATLGRPFRMEETWEGDDDVVVIGHDLWVRMFGSDPNVVGETLDLGTRAPEIVGVMPAGFHFPTDRTELWYPMGWAAEARTATWFRRAHIVRAFGRMAPGIDQAEANAQLQVVVDRLQTAWPETNSVMGAGIMPMRDFLTKDVRAQLLILLGAVGLLLVLACTNVASLMLVRANDRTREVALRRALGAGRGRVARQMFTESALIAGMGAVVGLGLGWLGVRALTLGDPLGIDGATSLALDHRVVLFALAIATVAGLFFGTAPVLRATAGDVEGALRENGRGSTTGRSGLRTVSALVTAEVALALLLVVGAGLMVRTFAGLRDVDPGFDPTGVVAVRFSVPPGRYENRDQVLAFYDRFVEALEARSDIEKAGTVGWLPLAGQGWSSQFQAEGWPPERVGIGIVHRRADADYFETVNTPLVRGRLFERTDGPDAPDVVVINETFAREHFPNEDPIGQKIAYDRAPAPDSNWREIIGIVGDQHQNSPKEAPLAEVFESRDQDWGRDSWVVVRGGGEAAGLVPAIRAVLEEMDPLIPIAETETLRDVWSRSMAGEEFVLKLLGLFGLVALLLASVGVYGVTAQAARRRTREIGIRMALGAGAPDVLRLMLRHGLVVIGLGLAAGMGVSVFAMRALSSMLYGVEPTDPGTLATVVFLLGGVALLACYVPARRATVVDPVRSLRAE